MFLWLSSSISFWRLRILLLFWIMSRLAWSILHLFYFCSSHLNPSSFFSQLNDIPSLIQNFSNQFVSDFYHLLTFSEFLWYFSIVFLRCCPFEQVDIRISFSWTLLLTFSFCAQQEVRCLHLWSLFWYSCCLFKLNNIIVVRYEEL